MSRYGLFPTYDEVVNLKQDEFIRKVQEKRKEEEKKAEETKEE